MSTVIYYAYRMSTKVFNETFLPSFRKHVFKKAKERVGSLVGLDPGAVEAEARSIYEKNSWATEMGWDSFWSTRQLPLALRQALTKTMVASKSNARDPYTCIDCSLNCWIYKGKVYCILYGESWLWKGYRKPAGVEDYAYWNNSDGPDGMSYAEFKKRGKTWDKVCLDTGWDSGRLVHIIIEAKSKQGLVELAQSFFTGEHAVEKAYMSLPNLPNE